MKHRWLDVFRYELRQQFRSKGYRFVTLIVPLLIIGAFYGYRAYRSYAGSDAEDQAATPVTEANEAKQVVGYLDRTPQGLFPAPESYPAVRCTPEADEVEALVLNPAQVATRQAAIKRISSPYCMRDSVHAFDDMSAAKTALKDGEIDVLVVFEPSFVEDGAISTYVHGISIQAMETDSLVNDFMVRSLLYAVDPTEYESLYLRLRDPAFVTVHRVDVTGAAQTENFDRNMLLVYAFGLVSMMGIFWGGGYLMQSVVQEKESRIIEIIMSSVPPVELLVGKVLAMGLAALLQLITLIGALIFVGARAGEVASALSDITVGAGTLAFFGVYFVLGYLLFGSLMACIGALSTSIREAQNFVVVVTLPAVVPFFFITIFAEEPNGVLARVLSFVPITASMSMVMRLSVTDVPAWELALSLALLVVAIAGAVWLAGRLFRVNTLLAGTMPRLKDLPRLLRQ